MPFPARPEPPDRSGPSPLHGLPRFTVLAAAVLVLALGLRGRGEVDASTTTRPEDTAAAPRDVNARTVSLSELAQGDLEPIGDGPLSRRDGGAVGDVERSAGEANGDGEAASTPVSERSSNTRGERNGWRTTGVSNAHDLAPSSPRERGPFRSGVRHGEWEILRADGTLEASGHYDQGLREGLWEHWSATGALVESFEYHAGAMHGDWSAWSDDGVLVGTGHYEDNLRSGRWVLYYSDGRVKESGLFVNGLREGPWEFFDDLGLPTVRTGTYRAGVKLP